MQQLGDLRREGNLGSFVQNGQSRGRLWVEHWIFPVHAAATGECARHARRRRSDGHQRVEEI
jgi:hypothetical protein